MRARMAGVALVLSLLAMACGDDEDDGAATAVDDPITTTTAAGGAEDIEELVLREADFPAGWTAEPADADDDAAAGEELEACLGLDVDDENRPEAESADFSQGPLTQASSSVSLAPDRAAVDAEFAAIQGPEFLNCAKQGVRQGGRR